MHGGSLSLKVTNLFGINFEKNIHQGPVKNTDLFMDIFFNGLKKSSQLDQVVRGGGKIYR